jgi:hypothetical protein
MHTLRGWHQAPAAIDIRGHFATIAEVTLDGIADTFCCFFGLPWTRAETSHTRLTATFPPFCVAHRLAGDTDDVYIRMRDLQTRLSTARSVDRPCADSLHETLRDFFTALDQYIIVLFHFFESNLESPYPVTQQC